ncbi:drug/metabolite transporter (DMT)-like permease [Rhizobium petrolearium]|uniref:DMT family transporter n=1 Tax=Neorhizobium petrolearium TaxID=515361 RepID=UPI001AE207CF|nr:DMT family transporter [Neorhizobium petrolearium]MBP1846307.1 drug/metabolite transporter (DMT)-like permease [Neorhizobium petrolearium]
MKFSPYITGLIVVLFSSVVLSTAGLMTRLVALDSATILVWRGIAGGTALFFFLLIIAPRRGFHALPRPGRPGLAICIASGVGMVLFITALQETSVAHVSIIFATCPFVSAGLGFALLGERPGRSALVASLAAMAGVIVMVGTGEAGGLLGDLLAFGMTVCVALMTVLMRRYPDQPVLITAGLAALLSAVLSLPFAAPLAASLQDIAIISLFGILGFALGIGLLLYGARLLPPVETALIGSLDAPLAPFWVWLFLGERLDEATLLGGSVVMAAVLLHVLFDLRRREAMTGAA